MRRKRMIQHVERHGTIISLYNGGVIRRINGIEVELTRTPSGFEVSHAGLPLGAVERVERVGEIMWRASGSKRFRTMMTQAVEELLVRAELIDGFGW